MQIQPTAIPGVVEVHPQVFGDERGFFLEFFRSEEFANAGLPTEFVQDNFSRSCRNTLRGLHYQIEQPQGKLVRVTSGAVFDVAVDLRRSSPAFGQWVGVELRAEDHNGIFIPAGCAHGFVVLSESADLLYKCTDQYAPEFERTLLWDDPTVGVEWPMSDPSQLILSEKDRNGLKFQDIPTFD